MGLGIEDSALGSQAFLLGVGFGLLFVSGDLALLLAINLASPAVGILMLSSVFFGVECVSEVVSVGGFLGMVCDFLRLPFLRFLKSLG